MTPHCLDMVLSLVGPALTRQTTQLRNHISAGERLVALCYLVTGDSMQTILRSCSLHRVRTFYKIFVLQDMHMILESLESDFKCTLIDTKISQIACWEHIEPKNNTLQWHSLIIKTSRGPVFTMEELAFHTINTFYS